MLFLPILLSLLLPAQGILTDASHNLKLRLVEEINRDRSAAGLPPVEYSEELSRAADEHCREMLRDGYVSHWNRAGLKPYMRYSLAGILDYTAENIWSLWKSNLGDSPEALWREIQSGHRSFMAERPPSDGHRKNILSLHHTQVGIGLAFDHNGLRLIEVFGARYARLKPLPAHAGLQDRLQVKGQLLDRSMKLLGVAIYYEPLPRSMTPEELSATFAYGLPEEQLMEREYLGVAIYADGSSGTISVGPSGSFSLSLRFWKGEPGVYTVAVWLREAGRHEPFIGAMTSVFVEGKKN